MDSIAIRKASQSDSEFAYCVKREAFREYVEKVWGWDEDEQQQLHQQRFDSQDFRIISLDGKDIGIMAVLLQADCLKLNQLFLMPGYQGMSIGTECMQRIIEESRQLYLPIRISVLKVNPRALAFYQRLGFVHTGETDTHVLMESAIGSPRQQ
jgi:GNAT superfamily N-acetyltransferase